MTTPKPQINPFLFLFFWNICKHHRAVKCAYNRTLFIVIVWGNFLCESTHIRRHPNTDKPFPLSTWKDQVILDGTLGSLSKVVFERRTSTGSGLFSSFDGVFAQIFSQIAFITVTKLRNKNFISSRHVKRENASLPVDVRRSKTPLLKLSISKHHKPKMYLQLHTLSNYLVHIKILRFTVIWRT